MVSIFTTRGAPDNTKSNQTVSYIDINIWENFGKGGGAATTGGWAAGEVR